MNKIIIYINMHKIFWGLRGQSYPSVLSRSFQHSSALEFLLNFHKMFTYLLGSRMTERMREIQKNFPALVTTASPGSGWIQEPGTTSGVAGPQTLVLLFSRHLQGAGSEWEHPGLASASMGDSSTIGGGFTSFLVSLLKSCPVDRSASGSWWNFPQAV